MVRALPRQQQIRFLFTNSQNKLKTLIGVLFLFFLSSLLYSQNPINEALRDYPDGTTSEYFKSGKIQIQFTKVNGNLEGARTSYFKSGKIQSMSIHKNGAFNGKNLEYYKDGMIKFEENYNMDAPNKMIRYRYYWSNKLKQEIIIEHPIDSAQMYPFEGTKYSNIYNGIVIDGDKNLRLLDNQGIVRRFYRNGQVKREFQHVSLKVSGKETSYRKDGRIHKEKNWLTGKKHGDFKVYRKNQKLKKHQVYERGKLKLTNRLS